MHQAKKGVPGEQAGARVPQKKAVKWEKGHHPGGRPRSTLVFRPIEKTPKAPRRVYVGTAAKCYLKEALGRAVEIKKIIAPEIKEMNKAFARMEEITAKISSGTPLSAEETSREANAWTANLAFSLLLIGDKLKASQPAHAKWAAKFEGHVFSHCFGNSVALLCTEINQFEDAMKSQDAGKMNHAANTLICAKNRLNSFFDLLDSLEKNSLESYRKVAILLENYNLRVALHKAGFLGH